MSGIFQPNGCLTPEAEIACYRLGCLLIVIGLLCGGCSCALCLLGAH